MFLCAWVSTDFVWPLKKLVQKKLAIIYKAFEHYTPNKSRLQITQSHLENSGELVKPTHAP